MVLNNRTTVFKREDYVKGKKCGFDTKFLNQSEKKNQKRGTWMEQALGWSKHLDGASVLFIPWGLVPPI
jgi:hypothetical protein